MDDVRTERDVAGNLFLTESRVILGTLWSPFFFLANTVLSLIDLWYPGWATARVATGVTAPVIDFIPLEI